MSYDCPLFNHWNDRYINTGQNGCRYDSADICSQSILQNKGVFIRREYLFLRDLRGCRHTGHTGYSDDGIEVLFIDKINDIAADDPADTRQKQGDHTEYQKKKYFWICDRTGIAKDAEHQAKEKG